MKGENEMLFKLLNYDKLCNGIDAKITEWKFAFEYKNIKKKNSVGLKKIGFQFVITTKEIFI